MLLLKFRKGSGLVDKIKVVDNIDLHLCLSNIFLGRRALWLN